MKEEDHRTYSMMERHLIERRPSSCVTNVTILDTLQGIAKNLIIRMELIREEMHLYVSYVITLDTQ